MRTSCRFAMAVHVLAVLAFREGDRVTSASLADSVSTNPVVVRRLLLSLQKARLVDTCKGAGAGSRLHRSPRRINLAEVYKSVEVSGLFAVPARKPGAACPMDRGILAVVARVCGSAQTALERDLAKTTLADVMNLLRVPPAGPKRRVA